MTDRMRSIDDIVGKTIQSMFSNRCEISLEQIAERTPGKDERFDLDMTPNGSAFSGLVATRTEMLIQSSLLKIREDNNRRNKEVGSMEYILTETRSRIVARNPILEGKFSRETAEREMTKSFAEINTVLKPGGVLSLTLERGDAIKPVELIAPVFSSLIAAGFQVLASCPIRNIDEKPEGDLVVIVALKKEKSGGTGCYDARMRREMLEEALKTSSELGVNGFDTRSRTIGSFGSAFFPFSCYDAVVTTTGIPQSVENAMLDILESLFPDN